jgi:DNA-binding Lrp family transcriptional regulator
MQSDTDGGSDCDRERRADPDVDETDRQIIDALLADGRASAADLSEVAGVPTATATKRLQRLEESGVVEGYRPEIDYEALGFAVTAVFTVDVEGGGVEEVVADLQATGRTVGVYEVTGEYDVVAVGKFTDTAELEGRIKELLTHPRVRGVSTNVVLDVVREDEQFPVSE